MEITRRRLLRDSIGAGAALTLGAAAGGLRIPQAAHAAPANDGHALGFRSLTDEISLPDIPVDGRIPGWLEGVLLRNGPGLFEIGEQKLNHWFDGLAMLHAFAFADGRVAYANRFLQSSAYKAFRREGVMKYSEFGTDPCRQIFSGVSTLPLIGKVPNANVSIEQLAGRFRAHTELPVPVNFDPHNLRTLGVEVDMPQGRMGTAHPHHDPRTRERFSYEIELVPPAGLRIVSERNGKRRELAWIPDDRPGYLHSFGLTDRFVVLFLQPWEFDLATFLSPDGGPIVKSFQWDDSQPARIMLVDRQAGGVAATFELDPAFVFHHINAFDDGDDVVLDVCAHRDAGVVDALYLKNLRKSAPSVPQASPRRLTVRPGRSKVRSRELADGNLELPRTDYDRVNGRPYRYAYGVGVRNPRKSGFVDRIAKLDVKRGEQSFWQERGTFPGEPIFARRPGSTREDDGALLSVVLDAGRRTSFLLVLDARDMSELARASVPHHIPFGFHGVHAARA